MGNRSYMLLEIREFLVQSSRLADKKKLRPREVNQPVQDQTVDEM